MNVLVVNFPGKTMKDQISDPLFYVVLHINGELMQYSVERVWRDFTVVEFRAVWYGCLLESKMG